MHNQLNCNYHNNPIKGACFFPNHCNRRLLCRECRKNHEKEHLSYYEELSDIVDGSLANDIASELGHIVKTLDHSSNNLEKNNADLIDQIDKVFGDA